MEGSAARGGSMGSATLWMIGLSVLMFWIPVAGPVFAGFVGGLKAGSVGPAIAVAVLPAILVAALVFVMSSVVELPGIEAPVGVGMLLVMVFQSLPLVAGAVLGGALAE